MRIAPLLILPAAVALSSLVCRDAFALGPVDIEVAAKVGYGTSTQSGVNVLGPGVGGRGGVSIFNFYFGVQGMYYFGGSQTIAFQGLPSVQFSYNSVLYGGEVGYSIGLPFVTIRPQVGVGNYTLNVSNGGGSQSNIYDEPGVTGLDKLGLWMFGADVNLLALPGVSGSQVAFTVHGQAGVSF